MKAPEVFLIVLSILCCISVHGQQFGGHPTSQKWRHIQNDSIDLIFPETAAEKASAIFSLISKIPSTLPSPHRVRRLPVVLQQKTGLSNGYVGMGPYRSEFQLTPSQNSFQLGSIPWYSQLALHEYRHVQQFDFFNRGIARVVYSVLGQEAGSLINNTAIPNWFWEGDAVWQETILSNQGRGRVPFFMNDLRVILRSAKNYSYMKWRNGSLRDLIPDHYQFGYLLIGYGNEKYGPGFWPATIADASRFKPLFYPFQGAFKRHSRISFQQFVTEAHNYYRKQEIPAMDSLALWANAQKHFVSDAEFPTWMNATELLYVKTSYRQIPAFYIYNTNTNSERRIATRRISLDNQFSYRNGRIVYASYQADRRWSWSDYTTIVITDLNTKTDRHITGKQKYFSPDINSDGTQVVAVSIDSASNSQLHIVDVATGGVANAMNNQENYFITYPKFFGEGYIISAVRDSVGRMGILKWDVHSGAKEFLLPLSKQVMGFPQVSNDTIVFTATNGVKESAFMLLPDKSLKKLNTTNTTSFSVYQPSLYGNTLAVTGASIAGNQLLRFPDAAFTQYGIDSFLQQQADGAINFESLDKGPIITSSLAKAEVIPSTPYKKGKHLFNFHSVRPFISDPDYSVSLISDNVLNDFRTELTYLYNTNEGYSQFGFFTTFAGLFPWIRGGVDYTLNRNYIYSGGQELRWDEVQPRIGLSVPLNFSKNYHFRSLQTSLDYVYSKQFVKGYYKDSLQAAGFGYLNPSINWVSRTQQARQDIYPRFAQSVSVDYKAAINRGSVQQFLATGGFYFPGLVLNHSLVMQAAYQTRSESDYQFSNSFPFSRGYSAINHPQMAKLGFNYHFPIAYPDAGIAQIVYLLRLRANPFFDITNTIDENGVNFVYKSAGAEIYFDTKWWNQESISFGIRYSYLLDSDPAGISNQWEFILPVNLYRR